MVTDRPARKDAHYKAKELFIALLPDERNAFKY
jgi:hypothetical protein